MKAEFTQIKSDIAHNAILAVDNDGRLKDGLMELEKQDTQNGAATTELRANVQAAVGAVAQHPSLASATGAAPVGASEMQSVRHKLDEVSNRTEHDLKTVQTRSDEVMQRTESLVASLRIDEVHRHLCNLDANQPDGGNPGAPSR